MGVRLYRIGLVNQDACFPLYGTKQTLVWCVSHPLAFFPHGAILRALDTYLPPQSRYRTGSNGRLLWMPWNQCLRDQCFIF